MNTEEIKVKHSKVLLVVGIIFLIIGAIAEIAILSDYMDSSSEELIGVIIACIFPAGIFLLMGVLMIIEYFKKSKRMRDILARYGEENIITHIRHNTIGVFQKNQYTDKVYFTDCFVVEPTTAIIHYGEISWMYKHITRHKNSSTVSIAFALLDGSKFFLCDYADDNDIAGIMQTCQQRNPNIILGYSKETEAQHEQNVKRFKSGLMPLAHTPISAETMNKSNAYEAGKRLAMTGLITIICTLLGVLICAFALENVVKDIGEIMLLVITIPGVIIGVSFLVSGIDKMKKSGNGRQ